MAMNPLLAICVGVGLSAACGFRVFVPMLVMSLAARSGQLQLAHGFDWIGSTPALLAFGTATGLEIAAYYVPWLDNLLDSIATPAAGIAGTIVTAACVSHTSPMLAWALGLIAGGGSAMTVQGLTVVARAASTATTGGVANPVVSTAEAGFSAGLSALAVLVPIVAAVIVLAVVFLVLRMVVRFFSRRKARAAMAGAQDGGPSGAPLSGVK